MFSFFSEQEVPDEVVKVVMLANANVATLGQLFRTSKAFSLLSNNVEFWKNYILQNWLKPEFYSSKDFLKICFNKAKLLEPVLQEWQQSAGIEFLLFIAMSSKKPSTQELNRFAQLFQDNKPRLPQPLIDLLTKKQKDFKFNDADVSMIKINAGNLSLLETNKNLFTAVFMSKGQSITENSLYLQNLKKLQNPSIELLLNIFSAISHKQHCLQLSKVRYHEALLWLAGKIIDLKLSTLAEGLKGSFANFVKTFREINLPSYEKEHWPGRKKQLEILQSQLCPPIPIAALKNQLSPSTPIMANNLNNVSLLCR